MKKILLVGLIFAISLTTLLLYGSETEYQNLLPEIIQQVNAPTHESVPLATQVGQLFAVGHWANMEASTTAARARNLQLGSIIIMSAPDTDSVVSEWTASWQAATETPLLISIDQEGGVVSRLRGAGHTQTAQPQITDTSTAYAVAQKRAQALHQLGINANYAPVLDKSTSTDSFMYSRVFRDSDKIATLGNAMVRGYRDGEVLAVAKHFPGHPDTSDDSHIILPILDITKDEYKRHTSQFYDAIKLGDTQMLMTAHVLVPALDRDFPATVSPIVLGDLRDRIGYTGVIITDDLAMQAISDRWGYAEAAVLAVQAGADMVMLAAEPENASSTVQAVIKAVEEGELSRERVFEAYNRVMLVKAQL
jgi:beta-N-acetylhexosaminidase